MEMNYDGCHIIFEFLIEQVPTVEEEESPSTPEGSAGSRQWPLGIRTVIEATLQHSSMAPYPFKSCMMGPLLSSVLLDDVGLLSSQRLHSPSTLFLPGTLTQ